MLAAVHDKALRGAPRADRYRRAFANDDAVAPLRPLDDQPMALAGLIFDLDGQARGIARRAEQPPPAKARPGIVTCTRLLDADDMVDRDRGEIVEQLTRGKIFRPWSEAVEPSGGGPAGRDVLMGENIAQVAPVGGEAAQFKRVERVDQACPRHLAIGA